MIKWFKKVLKKFSAAFSGFWIVIKEEKSLWVHLSVSLAVIIFGIIFELSTLEWAIIIFSIGLVIGFEILNTAIEYIVDIVSFEYSIKAKKIKDVAAMATLFVTLIAVAIGCLVFIPLFIELLDSAPEPSSMFFANCNMKGIVNYV